MITESSLGFEIESDSLKVFFGKSSSSLEALQTEFPKIDFVRLKQIHSDAVIESTDSKSDYQKLADSHWTAKKNLALCVITADCVPVFFFDPENEIIAGVHAGWRGVANQILSKTVKSLVAQKSSAKKLKVFIGPHIHFSSFEVAMDVRDQILSSLGPLSPEEKKNYFSAATSENKFYVDLQKVVRRQLWSLNIQEENIFSLDLNTFEDFKFHSHRRDKEKAGRQISFIVQKP